MNQQSKFTVLKEEKLTKMLTKTKARWHGDHAKDMLSNKICT